MKRKELTWIKTVLEAERERIIATTKSDIREGAEGRSDILDEIDLANAGEEQESRYSRHERNRGHFWQIEEALRRIDEGTFGFCEACDEPILAGRLKAYPTATLCIDCKRDQEDMERRNAFRMPVVAKSLFYERE